MFGINSMAASSSTDREQSIRGRKNVSIKTIMEGGYSNENQNYGNGNTDPNLVSVRKLQRERDENHRGEGKRNSLQPRRFKDWPSTLRQYIYDNAIRGGDFDAEHDVEVQMRQMFVERRAKVIKYDPTLKTIPRFYFRNNANIHRISHASADPTKNLDEEDQILGKSLGLLRRLARNRYLQRVNAEILCEEDLNHLCTLLTEHISTSQDASCKGYGMINYEELVRIGSQLRPNAACYFSPSTFSKFRRNRQGLISADLFFQYVCRHVSLCQTRVELSVYDVQGDGYLREQDLENFIYKLIPTLEPLTDLQDNFYPFYVFTAVRKFFFFLDPRRTCKVLIKNMLVSPVLDELLQLRDDSSNWDEERDARNWFSAHNALRVYSQYLELDVDHNGMLSKSELAQFGAGTLTSSFIDRIFEECHTYDGEMDYKTFLDFVLAMENKNSPQALLYFWRLLDIKKVGYLDVFTINFFFREIRQKLIDIDGDIVDVEDVKDEIFDMVKPTDPAKITFADFERCRVGGTIVSMLTDLNGFWEYDNRENIIAEEAREELEQLMQDQLQ